MKSLAKIIFCLSFVTLFSCSNNEDFLTEHKDAWFRDPNRGLVYCRANIKDGGNADPVCFEAGFQRYKD